jgi:hypothetical protein
LPNVGAETVKIAQQISDSEPPFPDQKLDKSISDDYTSRVEEEKPSGN